jgi:hypothetical protein
VPVDAVLYGTTNTNKLLGPDGLPSIVHVGDATTGSSILRTGEATWEINATPNSTGCTPPLP